MNEFKEKASRIDTCELTEAVTESTISTQIKATQSLCTEKGRKTQTTNLNQEAI